MAKETEEVLVKVEVDESGAVTGIENTSKSMEDLAKVTDKLTEARKKQDLTTKQGRQNAAAYTKEIEKNNEIVGKATKSTGSWSDSFKTLTPGLYGATTNMLSLTKAAWAFIATPVGAIVAAIAVVLGTLYAAVQRTTLGMDKFEDVITVVSTALKVLLDRAAAVGEGLIKVFSGDVNEGLEEIGKSMVGIGDEMEREVGLALELNEALRALEDAEIAYDIAASESLNTIKQLILEGKNRGLTEEQRTAKLTEARKIEEGLNKQDLANKRAAIKAAIEQANIDKVGAKLIQEKGESEYDYGKRIVLSGQYIDDNRDKIKEALIEYNRSVGESIGLQEKLQNAQDALAEKIAENAKKQAELDKAKREAQEREIDALILQEEGILRRNEMEMAFDLNTNEERQRLKEEQLANFAKMEADRLKKLQADAKKEEEIEKYKTKALLAMTNMLFKERSAARVALNILLKQDALKEIAVNTKAGAVAAYKSLAGIPFVGPVLGAIAAAAVVAYGLMSAATVAGITFAKGGKVGSKRGTFKGRSHDQGGEHYVNTRTGHAIEVEGDENFYVLKKSASREINKLSALNVKHGGRSFGEHAKVYGLGGAVETRGVTLSQGMTVSDIQTIVRATISGVRIVTDVKDVIRETDNIVEVENTARVMG